MSSSTACTAWSSCLWDDQFERGGRSCVNVDVDYSVETLDPWDWGEMRWCKHGKSRRWWQQTDSHRRSGTSPQTSRGWLEQNHYGHFGGWRLQVAEDWKHQRIPIRHWKHRPMSTKRWRQIGKLSAARRHHAVSTQDSESVQSLRARTDDSMNNLNSAQRQKDCAWRSLRVFLWLSLEQCQVVAAAGMPFYVRLSICHTLARYQNGWTYCHDFFTTR